MEQTAVCVAVHPLIALLLSQPAQLFGVFTELTTEQRPVPGVALLVDNGVAPALTEQTGCIPALLSQVGTPLVQVPRFAAEAHGGATILGQGCTTLPTQAAVFGRLGMGVPR